MAPPLFHVTRRTKHWWHSIGVASVALCPEDLGLALEGGPRQNEVTTSTFQEVSRPKTWKVLARTSPKSLDVRSNVLAGVKRYPGPLLGVSYYSSLEVKACPLTTPYPGGPGIFLIYPRQSIHIIYTLKCLKKVSHALFGSVRTDRSRIQVPNDP